MRDIMVKPYSPEESRAAEYICEFGIGGGDDPVGFLIASHRELVATIQQAAIQIDEIDEIHKMVAALIENSSRPGA
jgi:hypothetical protein